MKKKIYITISIIICLIGLISCSASNSKENSSSEGDYFNKIKNNGIDSISIQSVRDKSFKFLVTNDTSIDNMYNLLSKAKESEVKSELDPDFIFEIQSGDEIKSFNYIVGSSTGNFYNEEVSFTMTKRLDEAIMQNLSIIRKPRDFEYIYYNPILDVIKLNEEDMKDKKIGINFSEDIDALKYIFSSDIENFLEEARDITKDIEIVKNNASEFDYVITIKNRGHDTTIYKTNIILNNNETKLEYNYYVFGEYEFKEWNYNVYENSEVPKSILNNW